jgi:hypothetical protein
MGGRYQSSNPHLATILVMSQKLLPPVAFVEGRNWIRWSLRPFQLKSMDHDSRPFSLYPEG